ncbi:MAG: NAD(P)/FAD-dependent oxidoreductase [Caldilineaceae bacterium]|nr:NAD(P)/FAD-dependent oxidoreductase [Caldilineaceae bacterium]
MYDAVVVGSGPNGLAAAIFLARAGARVLVIEGEATVGGGMRTAPLTLPGFRHDVCSAVHPLGMGSSFLRTLPLADYGLEWLAPPIPLAHPLDDGSAVALYRDAAMTGAGIGGPDGERWRERMGRLTHAWPRLAPALLGPRPFSPHLLDWARFGLSALQSASFFARRTFAGERARALFAGLAGHAIRPLERPATASVGLVLGMLAHAVGWPLPRGGSQALADAMVRYLQALGGEVVCGWMVEMLAELPPARHYLLDITPRQFLQMAGDSLPGAYRTRLAGYRYGPGVFKLDYALAGPVPWTAPECRAAGTVHVGGTLAEIAAGEREVWYGRHALRPYVLAVQPGVVDESRAPAGKQTLWAYCHVPHNSDVDMSHAVEEQIERFAPGFRELILARSARTAQAMHAYNPNYIGGDINGGVQDLGQIWTRPVPRLSPYSTPLGNVWLCSSATPPGGGVHGMCGYHAARAVMGRLKVED